MLFVLLFILISSLVSSVFAVSVETLDEQLNSTNLTVLRLRVNNESDRTLYNINVKYFIQKNNVSI